MTYKDLNVFKRAYQVAIDLHIYLNKNENKIIPQYRSEIRRSARLALVQIAEGYSQGTPKWKRVYNFRAIDTFRRLMMDIDFLHDIKSIPEKEYKYFLEEYSVCVKQLYKLNNSILNKENGVEPESEKSEKQVQENKVAVAA